MCLVVRRDPLKLRVAATNVETRCRLSSCQQLNTRHTLSSSSSSRKQDGVKTLSAEISQSPKSGFCLLIYQALTSLRSTETVEKNLCCRLKVDIMSVIDVNENEHTNRRYAVVVFVLMIKFMMIRHC